MKNKFIVLAVLAIMCFSLVFAVACGDNYTQLKAKDENLGNYEGLEVAEGLSAYDLVMEAYQNWCNDENYVRDEYFSFSAGVFASRNTHLIRKVKGEEIYSQEIIYGTGLDSGSCTKKYYFDGSNAYFTNVAGSKHIKYDKDNNVLTTTDWGTFAPFTGDVQEENRVMTEHMTTYDLTSREYLADEHDDTVYVDEGVYYCTLTIDCSEETMKTVHRAALDEFLANTGAKEEGFTCQNTTIDFAIEKIGGKMKLVIWKRNEAYSGKHASISVTVNCKQTCLTYFTYDNAEITSDDLAGLDK